MNYYSTPPTSDELWHFGIKGMKWGVRRYQNEDGSLTSAGKKRYYKYKDEIESAKKYLSDSRKARSVKKSQKIFFDQYIPIRNKLASRIYNKDGRSIWYEGGAVDYAGRPVNKRAKRSIALADDLIKKADFTAQPKVSKKEQKQKTYDTMKKAQNQYVYWRRRGNWDKAEEAWNKYDKLRVEYFSTKSRKVKPQPFVR